MAEIEEAWRIAGDRTLFEKIHQLKGLYESVFYRVANRISETGLGRDLPGYKGYKVSKGNELEQCPYHVLDLVRDFDLDRGLNLRLLHWWGRGTYLLVFIGKENPIYPKIWGSDTLPWFEERGYRWADTDSLWHYKEIIDGGAQRPLAESLRSVIDTSLVFRLQLVRALIMKGSQQQASDGLFGELEELVSVLMASSADNE